MKGRIGVVAIGRNEGQRLEACLRSLLGKVDDMVYIDSGSSDGSVERARSLGVDAIALTQGPFTAARGRQAGFDRLLERNPRLEFVQFVDGDCVVHEQWLTRGVERLQRDPRLGAVGGRRREERCDASFWSRIIDVDWDAPPGRAAYTGGDGLYRAQALQEIGGWDASLIAGEDPDVGFRLLDAGWRIERLPVEMTSHDMAMTRFGQYWRRAVRSGHAYMEVGYRHRRGAGKAWWRRALSIVAYGVILPVAAVLGALAHWSIPLVVALLYARLFWSLYRSCRRKSCSRGLSAAYAGLNVACKFASAWGALAHLTGAMTGRRSRIIEYKRAGGRVAAASGAGGAR